ncbi:MAG: DnaJ domain-containing protein, partial [Magnetococcales bacterium]|nr:DnaJ domain-containing protein [Magnetococcales bacterium]
LRVTQNATQEQIRRAYRRLAREQHPDLNHSPFAEERFKTIGEAYEVLGNPDKRAEYDRQIELSAIQQERSFSKPFGQQAKTGSQHQTGSRFGSKARSFFNKDTKNRFGPKSESRLDKNNQHRFDGAKAGRFGTQAKAPGTTTATRTNFSSTHKTTQKPASSFKAKQPTNSHATKAQAAPVADLEVKLILPLENVVISGPQEIRMDIPELNGQRVLHVEIPRGVDDGQRIRLKGQGKRHPTSGRRGDLVLLVSFPKHPTFRLDGRDLYTKLTLTPWEAALGCKIHVPTLDGDVKVKIPAGSSSGRKIRLKGKGLPGRISAFDGDLLMEVMIAVPEKLSFTERHLLKKLASASKFSPRPDID